MVTSLSTFSTLSSCALKQYRRPSSVHAWRSCMAKQMHSVDKDTTECRTLFFKSPAAQSWGLNAAAAFLLQSLLLDLASITPGLARNYLFYFVLLLLQVAHREAAGSAAAT